MSASPHSPARRRNPLLSEVEAVLGRVAAFKREAKTFYLQVLLVGHICPRCGQKLVTVGPSRCECLAGHVSDPTLAFQRSTCCGSVLRKRICHYACARCGRSVPSRFLFNERVFDAAYFRDRMRLSRQQRNEKRRRLCFQAIAGRSQSLVIEDLSEIDAIPGLDRDLDEFIGEGDQVDDGIAEYLSQDIFDMTMYQRTIRGILVSEGSLFSEIPPLTDNRKLDRARRFISLVFMEHVGEVSLAPFGHRDILVMPREAHS